MSQFCLKVNIRAFRWLDLAIIHSIVGILILLCFFWMEGGGGTKHFLTFVGGLKFLGNHFGEYHIFAEFFQIIPSTSPPPPHNTYFNDDSLIEPGIPETGMCGTIFLSEIGYRF